LKAALLDGLQWGGREQIQGNGFVDLREWEGKGREGREWRFERAKGKLAQLSAMAAGPLQSARPSGRHLAAP